MENILRDKAYKFALRIVKLYQYLATEKREFIMSNKSLDPERQSGQMLKRPITDSRKWILFISSQSPRRNLLKRITGYDCFAIADILQLTQPPHY